MTHPVVAELLSRYPTPAKLVVAGRRHVQARLRKHAPRLAESLITKFFTVLEQQTVVVAGTEAASGHLASYAEVVPVTRRSRISLRGGPATKNGNERLKRALFLSPSTSLRHPPSTTRHDRERAQG